MRDQPPIPFELYRWTNKKTTCDYPFLALAADRSALLAIGNWGLSFEWGVTGEAAEWLRRDFGPTGESLSLDIATVRLLLDSIFTGGSEFGLVTFDRELRPNRLQLSLQTQEGAEEGPEYLLHELGRYERVHREAGQVAAVGLPERAMLDVFVSTFTALGKRHAALLTEPPPPRYCSTPEIVDDRAVERPTQPRGETPPVASAPRSKHRA